MHILSVVRLSRNDISKIVDVRGSFSQKGSRPDRSSQTQSGLELESEIVYFLGGKFFCPKPAVNLVGIKSLHT